jgi:hypothetical protein
MAELLGHPAGQAQARAHAPGHPPSMATHSARTLPPPHHPPSTAIMMNTRLVSSSMEWDTTLTLASTSWLACSSAGAPVPPRVSPQAGRTLGRRRAGCRGRPPRVARHVLLLARPAARRLVRGWITPAPPAPLSRCGLPIWQRRVLRGAQATHQVVRKIAGDGQQCCGLRRHVRQQLHGALHAQGGAAAGGEQLVGAQGQGEHKGARAVQGEQQEGGNQVLLSSSPAGRQAVGG